MKLIETSAGASTIWGTYTTDTFETRLGTAHLSRFADGYMVHWDKIPDAEAREPIVRQIINKYKLNSGRGIGVRLAQLAFAAKDDLALYGLSEQQLLRIAQRAIALLPSDLQTRKENEAIERKLSEANDCPVHLPNQGWLELLAELVAKLSAKKCT